MKHGVNSQMESLRWSILIMNQKDEECGDTPSPKPPDRITTQQSTGLLGPPAGRAERRAGPACHSPWGWAGWQVLTTWKEPHGGSGISSKQGLTLLHQAVAYICLAGGVGKRRWERRYVEWGDSFGPIVTRHIGCRCFQVRLCWVTPMWKWPARDRLLNSSQAQGVTVGHIL